MYFLIKLFLFRFPPEKAHKITANLVRVLLNLPLLGRLFKKHHLYENSKLKRTVFGLSFENPIGLAAGFDKNASLYNDFSNFGFGFIEIGTVTPKAQKGNPQPRLFRLVKDSAIINRMGFNNDGVELVVKNLKHRKTKIIIGGNIGKNKWTKNTLASEDYLICFNALFPYVDYFVVNVSSPNTPNLRELQDKIPLMNLLTCIQNCNNSKKKRKPLLLKISPDLSQEELDDIIDVVLKCNLDGIVATNTTIDRASLKTKQEKISLIGEGGLSGKPLKQKSTEIISYIHNKTKGEIPIIGVGGIHSPEDAIEKLKAGASLIQLYTGFIYEGPSLIKKINKEIIKNN